VFFGEDEWQMLKDGLLNMDNAENRYPKLMAFFQSDMPNPIDLYHLWPLSEELSLAQQQSTSPVEGELAERFRAYFTESLDHIDKVRSQNISITLNAVVYRT
jgi:hypothetical protein